MSSIFPYPKGSVWRKWDLHVHSPLSLLNNQFPKLPTGEPDWESFLSGLEASDLAVLGVTDYFTIDGYKKIREFKQAGRLASVHAIFPNVEFRLNTLVSGRRDGSNQKRLNLHVIFSDEVSPQDIEEHFLHDLHFYYEGNPQDRDETRKLKLSNIEALGARLIQEHQPFQDRTAREIGAMNIVVAHEEITKLLSGDSRFKDKYFIVFPEELFNLIDWDGQDHHVRKSILQKSDMVFTSNRNTISWCLGRDPYTAGPIAFMSEFKTLKPCVHGSDAHKIEEIGRPCARRAEATHRCTEPFQDCHFRYCWIKADPTFEGLKQIIYEPADRVRIQQDDPTPLKSNYCIERIDVTQSTINSELTITKTSLDLNHGLVAVTGGKGSGKTALVDLIANCYVDRRSTGDANSFVKRVAGDKPDLSIKLAFRDGTIYEKQLTDPGVFEESQIVYIAQGELERRIDDNSDLDKYVRNLIFESSQVRNTVKAYEFENLTLQVRQIQETLLSIHDAIVQLEDATTQKAEDAAKLEIKQSEAELRDVKTKLQELETHLSADKLDVSRQKQEEIGHLEARKHLLIELDELLSDTLRFVEVDLEHFNSQITRANKILNDTALAEPLAALVYPDQIKMKSAIQSVAATLNDIIAKIDAKERELKQFESGTQEHSKLLSRQRELEGRVQKATIKIHEIHKSRNELNTRRVERRQQFEKLLETIFALKTKYAEIIELFGSEKAEVLSDLDFVAQLQFESRSLLQGAEDVLDNRQVEVKGDDRVKSVFDKLLALYSGLTRGDVHTIVALVDETDALTEGLKTKLKKSQAISVTDLYKCLYGTYLNVVPVVTYKQTALGKLSLGQKATVLIKIYLAQGDNPIIIDSHDDHLDNEFIMEELVGAIRRAKEYRQVILASNNGNVVINSDADQIIMANRQDGVISYSAGSIENPAMRDRALKVLEGGQSAFRKRQQKYRLTFN